MIVNKKRTKHFDLQSVAPCHRGQGSRTLTLIGTQMCIGLTSALIHTIGSSLYVSGYKQPLIVSHTDSLEQACRVSQMLHFIPLTCRLTS